MTDLQNSASGGGKLAALLGDIATMLSGAEGSIFASGAATVLTEDLGDMDDRITAALNQLGLCATVMLTGLHDCVASLPRPTFRHASALVEICECSAINRARQPHCTALDAAEQVAKILHCKHVSDGRVSKRVILVTNIERYATPPAPADVCWRVNISTGEVALSNALV